MEQCDPAIQDTAVFSWETFLTLCFFHQLENFFFGALVTAFWRRRKEERLAKRKIMILSRNFQ